MTRLRSQGEPLVVWDEGGLRVARAHSCFRELTWQVVLPEAARLDLDAFVGRLLAAGSSEVRIMPTLRLHDVPGDHRLVIVMTTGRVELRLHYLTGAEDRCDAARAVAAWLAEAMTRGS
ncbi:MAG: hypothetical protein KC731_08535 [Myxococcales bacterium]|nr:hypothetical protein [Myxococcales bacterium]